MSTVTYSLTVFVDEGRAEEVLEFLQREFPEIDWDYDGESEIYASCEANSHFEKGILYSPNGDGTPAECWIDSELDEDYVRDLIEEHLGIVVETESEVY